MLRGEVINTGSIVPLHTSRIGSGRVPARDGLRRDWPWSSAGGRGGECVRERLLQAERLPGRPRAAEGRRRQPSPHTGQCVRV